MEQVLGELRLRIQRLKIGPGEPEPVEQLRNNLKRVLNFLLAERELTDILLNHSTGFNRELDVRIREFYECVADQIQRSLDLGIQMQLVRECDSRAVAYRILGGIKEVVGQASRHRRRDIGSWPRKSSTSACGVSRGPNCWRVSAAVRTPPAALSSTN